MALLFVAIFLSGTIVAAAHAHEGGQTRAYTCAVCAHAGVSAGTPPTPVDVFACPDSDFSEWAVLPAVHERRLVRTTRARAPPR